MFVFGQVAKNLNTALFDAAFQTFKQFIPELEDLITNRLFNEGTDSFGVPLQTDTSKQRAGNRSNFYSDVTVEFKRQIGKKTSNVTLNDSGDFYNSIVVSINKSFLEINADFQKSDGNIQENFETSYSSVSSFENAILGYTDKQWQIFIESEFLPVFIPNFLTEMMQGI